MAVAVIASPPTSQTLHRAEQVLLLMDETLRGLGYAGFGLQLHLRLSGRCDVERLRTAIARLGQQYPVTTSRLDRSRPAKPVWRFQPGAVLELEEWTLESAGDAAILPAAEELLGTPRSLAETEPIRFVLLHLADGTDALIVHYSHVLMDSNAALLLLAELNRLADEPPGPPVAESADYRSQYLRRHSWRVRLGGAIAAVRQRAELMRRPTAMLTDERPDPSTVVPTRVVLRSLDRDATKTFAARVRQVTGFRGISLALLLSAFRAMKRCSPNIDAGSNFVSSVGMNLRDPGGDGPIFRNLASLLRFGVQASSLDDWEESLRRLNREMRSALARHLDVGMVQMTSLLNPRSASGRRLNERGMLRQQSIGYGYFGTSPQERQGLCGVPIERLYHVVQNWSPPGLALVANESQGRLLISTMYTPATVSTETAERFADALVAELTTAG